MTNKQKALVATAIAVPVFGAGLIIGRLNQVPTKVETVTVVDEQSRLLLTESLRREEQLKSKLETAEKTISNLKVVTKEKIRIVYRENGSKASEEKETSTDVNQSTDNSKNSTETSSKDTTTTDNKQADIDTKVRIDTKTITTVMPKDKFYLGITQPITLPTFPGTSSPGLEFKYRMFDLGKISVWAGGEVFLSPVAFPTSPQFRVGAGVSF